MLTANRLNAVAVLVPVKAFDVAKARLAPALSPPERAGLARRMAEAVVAAARDLPVYVACDDAAVARWAEGLGATVVWTPGRGLNGAVEDGVVAVATAGTRRVIVAHADLPLAVELAPVARFDGVTLVPDHRNDGTNVACVPTGAGFGFAYGPGSLARHSAEADRLGLALRILREPALARDVDHPCDLGVVELLEPTMATPR